MGFSTFKNIRTQEVFQMEKSEFKIGRGPGNDIQLEPNFVSRRHAFIRKTSDSDNLMIKNISDRNWIKVNDKILQPGESGPIRHQDVISIAGIDFEVFEPDATIIRNDNSNDTCGIYIDYSSQDVYFDGKKAKLSKQGYDFIRIIYEGNGSLVEYSALCAYFFPESFPKDNDPREVWNAMPEKSWKYEESREQMKRKVNAIKADVVRRLKEQNITEDYIKTKSGRGYQLDAAKIIEARKKNFDISQLS